MDQIFPERHAVRVVFPDKDNLTSAELPVLGSFCAGNSSFALPDIGESVLVLNSTNDDVSGSGFVIGSRYNDKNPPKVNSIDKTRMDFKDGSFIEFDRSSGILNIDAKGSVKISASVSISGNLAVSGNINCSGNIYCKKLFEG